jgi:hypothetical protein
MCLRVEVTDELGRLAEGDVEVAKQHTCKDAVAAAAAATAAALEA